MTADGAQAATPSTSAVYVYYRLREGAQTTATGAAATLQGTIAARLGVRGRLLIKRGEPLLWMEVYEDVGNVEHLLDALAAEAERLDFAALLQPGKARAVEVFIPAACA